MYFRGRLCVDPSELTKIKKVKPQTFFKKFLHKLSQGKINDLVEEENFTAISILQQLNQVLNKLDITNVIRLGHNGHDYFLDKEGKDDDLGLALETFEVNRIEDKVLFETLSLVLEKNQDSFHYYIDIRVNRSHKVGEYPIEVRINGVLNEFHAQDTERQKLKLKMEHVFRSQDAYDFYLDSKLKEFNFFIKTIQEEIQLNIPIDDIINESSKNIILAKKPIKSIAEIRIFPNHTDPIFHDYYKSRERSWYIYLWPELSSDHDMYIRNISILSDKGKEIGQINHQGIEAGDSELFNYDHFQMTHSEQEQKEDEPQPTEEWF